MRIAYLCADRGIALGGSKGAAVHMAEIVTALAALRRRGAPPAALGRRRAPALPPGVTRGSPTAGRDGRRPRGLARGAARASSEPRRSTSGSRCTRPQGRRQPRRLGIPYLVELNAPLPEEAARYRSLDRPGGGRPPRARGARERRRRPRGQRAARPLRAQARRAGSSRYFPNAVAPARFPRASRRASRAACSSERSAPGTGWTCSPRAGASWGGRRRACSSSGTGRGEGARGRRREGHRRGAARASSARCSRRRRSASRPTRSDAPGYFSPLKLFEYLAAGLAVVAGSIDGVREIVGPEQAVLVAAGGSGGAGRGRARLGRGRAAAGAPRRRRDARSSPRATRGTGGPTASSRSPTGSSRRWSRERPGPGARLLVPYVRREWRSLATVAVTTGVAAAAELARPLPLALIVNALIAEAGARPGSSSTAGTSGCSRDRRPRRRASRSSTASRPTSPTSRSSVRASGSSHDLRLETHAELQRLSLGYHARRPAGDLVTRVTSDVHAVGGLFSESLGTVVSSVLLLARDARRRHLHRPRARADGVRDGAGARARRARGIDVA